MPYFVYRITTPAGSNSKKLQYVQTYDNYKDARGFAREQRAALADQPDQDCRMIFAKNQTEAEKLLSAPREERVVGED
jgi:hypothetical protein